MRFEFEGAAVMEENECMNLPPGFRFHPTDEEIITHYLSNKVLNSNFSARAMGDVDLNKCEPWDLPEKAKMGEKAWYFFCQKDRKYPTGMRTNRATEAGYWKATGKDKDIYKGKRCLVGMKKTLVFYKGRAPKGEKTNWVMHEFRLEGKFSYCNLPIASQNEWVVCKVFHKTTGMKRTSVSEYILESPSLHPLFDPPYSNTNQPSVGDFDDIHKRTLTASRTSNGIHLSHLSTGMEDQQDYNSSPSSNIAFPCNSLSDLPLTIPGSTNLGYLDHIRKKSIPIFPSYGCESPAIAMLSSLASIDAASGLKIQCKGEQFSYQSIVSQDTGLGAEVNTEISSEASEHEIGSGRSYEDLKGIISAIPAVPIDLECLWNY